MADSDTPIQTRSTITGGGMYTLLLQEFARLRPATCMRCRVSLPFWGPAPGNHVLWFLQPLPPCPKGCHQVLAELWARLSTEYRIEPPQATTPAAREGKPRGRPPSKIKR